MMKDYCLYRGAKIAAFDTNEAILNPINSLKKFKGHRFDGINHNWMVQNMEFISLSHCYMTLIVKENKEKSIKFDQEGYNYVINRRTCFLDPDLMLNNHKELEHILKSFETIDPRLINLLLYSHKVYKEDSK